MGNFRDEAKELLKDQASLPSNWSNHQALIPDSVEIVGPTTPGAPGSVRARRHVAEGTRLANWYPEYNQVSYAKYMYYRTTA